MKDFINQFRKDSKFLDEKKTKSKNHNPKSSEVELAKELINAYRNTYADIDLKVLRNLIELKEITNQTKHEHPANAAKQIAKRLGKNESEETLRQERWYAKVFCPACGSKNIICLTNFDTTKNTKRQYECQDCQNIFNDETGTPLETGVPPLSTWMFCWYLMGCSTSLQYIATKLGLDLTTVEYMVLQLQKMFKSQQPLTHFLTYDEWSLKHGKSYKESIEQELTKRQELYHGDTSHTPKDTAEYRRQKERSRDPSNPNPHRNKPKHRGS